jgi:NADH-quinone oxidoreductase subunit L
MFVMVTLIASCIHVYSLGYMHEELHEVTDHEVTLVGGEHLKRRGRFHRFFQYLSLFSFSMLGVLIAGNMLMVFVFWELVGICSYFLIGFYIERHSASTAANKAFIVNRVGDFGMLIGLMAIWSGLGTFTFGDRPGAEGVAVEPGLFSLVRSAEHDYRWQTPAPVVQAALRGKKQQIRRLFLPEWPVMSGTESPAERAEALERWTSRLGEWRSEVDRWSAKHAAWMEDNRE